MGALNRAYFLLVSFSSEEGLSAPVFHVFLAGMVSRCYTLVVGVVVDEPVSWVEGEEGP